MSAPRERRARHAAPAPQPTQISYDLPVHELLGPDGVRRIHDASMCILAEHKAAVALEPRHF